MWTIVAIHHMPAGAGGLGVASPDQLKSLGDFAAIVLALLTFFTGLRAARLASDDDQGLGRLSRGVFTQIAVDGALALFTAAACLAMFSSFANSISIDHWGDRSQALGSMFSLVYIGFLVIFILQIALILGRLVPSAKNSLNPRRSGGTAKSKPKAREL
jgi:hypothetical protein